MANEIELKLRITGADARRLRQHPAILSALQGEPVTRKLVSTYYDTPQLALLDAGLSLRVRRMSGGWFQAVKAAGHSSAGLHQRMEWEDIISAGRPDFSKITHPELTRVFDDESLRATLAPIFTTDVRRTEWQLAWDNGDKVELALDLGQLIAGEHREPISEIELELKGGHAARLFQLALELQQDIPLELENVSKAQRGYAHYRPQPPGIARARRTRLGKHADAATAFRQIAWECLEQLQGNHDMVLHGDDAEGVHQMRVALRRLRSAFNVFQSVIDQSSATALLQEIRWITDTLGRARDLDVFVTQTLPPLRHLLLLHKAWQPLRERAEAQRKQAYADVHAALGAQRYHRLLLQLAGWLESSRQHHAAQQHPEVSVIAGQMLEKRYRQLRRHGKRLAALSVPERHAARIAAKKLRYAAEFFASLYPAEKSYGLVRRLTQLQDVLGELNDLDVTETMLVSLAGARPGRQLSAALLIFSGWNASETHQQLAAMQRAWKRFSSQKPFWR